MFQNRTRGAAEVRVRALEELADSWSFVGAVVKEPGFHSWCVSPLATGRRVDLFVSRWPISASFDPGWKTHSEIARYVSHTGPEGPFTFAAVVAGGRGAGWNARAFHNSKIVRIEDKLALLYIANAGVEPVVPSQQIGILIADDVDGPWQPITEPDRPSLSPPTDPSVWCHGSPCGVNNPTLLALPSGRLMLYFKAAGPDGLRRMGVAIADDLAGPWQIQPAPITANTRAIEDGHVFWWNDRVCLLTTDNHGLLEPGGGLLWTSADGLTFDPEPLPAYHQLAHYLPSGIPAGARSLYGDSAKLERPEVLMLDSEPRYLYAPSGCALDGADGTSCYLLKRSPAKD